MLDPREGEQEPERIRLGPPAELAAVVGRHGRDRDAPGLVERHTRSYRRLQAVTGIFEA
jgi:hypothetical protein